MPRRMDGRTDDIITQVTKNSRSFGTQPGAGGEEIPAAGVSRQTPEPAAGLPLHTGEWSLAGEGWED